MHARAVAANYGLKDAKDLKPIATTQEPRICGHAKENVSKQILQLHLSTC